MQCARTRLTGSADMVWCVTLLLTRSTFLTGQAALPGTVGMVYHDCSNCVQLCMRAKSSHFLTASPVLHLGSGVSAAAKSLCRRAHWCSHLGRTGTSV